MLQNIYLTDTTMREPLSLESWHHFHPRRERQIDIQRQTHRHTDRRLNGQMDRQTEQGKTLGGDMFMFTMREPFHQNHDITFQPQEREYKRTLGGGVCLRPHTRQQSRASCVPAQSGGCASWMTPLDWGSTQLTLARPQQRGLTCQDTAHSNSRGIVLPVDRASENSESSLAARITCTQQNSTHVNYVCKCFIQQLVNYEQPC